MPRRPGVKQGKELDEPPLAISGQQVGSARLLRCRQSEQCCVALGSLQAKRDAGQDRHRECGCRAGRVSAEEYAVPHVGDIHDEMASGVQLAVNDNLSTGGRQAVLGLVRCFDNGRSCCEVGVPDCRAARWRLARIAGESSGPIARPDPPVLHRPCPDRQWRVLLWRRSRVDTRDYDTGIPARNRQDRAPRSVRRRLETATKTLPTSDSPLGSCKPAKLGMVAESKGRTSRPDGSSLCFPAGNA